MASEGGQEVAQKLEKKSISEDTGMEIQRVENNEVRVTLSPGIFLEGVFSKKPACWGYGCWEGWGSGFCGFLHVARDVNERFRAVVWKGVKVKGGFACPHLSALHQIFPPVASSYPLLKIPTLVRRQITNGKFPFRSLSCSSLERLPTAPLPAAFSAQLPAHLKMTVSAFACLF